MRLSRKSWWSLAAVAVLVFLMSVPGDVFARPRPSRSRPSPSRVTAKAPKSKAATPKRGGRTGKASKKGSWGSSKKKAGKSKKATAADRKTYEKAKAQGTTFKTRKAAADNFKKKNAAKYASSYTSKPATRPGHIPQTTMVGGAQTTIIYNQTGGGYGYMNSLGTFMLYNAMADVAMDPYYNRQMASAGYYYGAPPRYGPGGGMMALIVVGILIAVVILFVAIKGSLGHSKGKTT